MSSRRLSFAFLLFGLLVFCPMSAYADVKAGLVGHWPLDGDATDASTNRNDGTVVGSVRPVPDRYGVSDAALFFPGEAGAYVDLGDPVDLHITGAMTITAWVFLDGSNLNDGVIITKRDAGGSGAWDLSIRADSGGVANVPTFSVAGSASTPAYADGIQSLPTDRWVHITGIYWPGESVEIYIDGFPEASQFVDVPTSQFSDNGAAVWVGSRNGGADCGWDGLIDEIRVYDRAISQVEIWQVMRANVGCSSSPHPAHGATDVSFDTALSWKAGVFAVTHDPYFGTVFEDVNNASRTSPGGVLISRGRGSAAYTPTSTLEFGQTYYWRVDEVNAFDSAIYKGDVWNFTVESYAPSLDPLVATSNAISDEGKGPGNTIDGSGLNADDEHSNEPNNMWLGTAEGDDPVWIQYRFDTTYALDQMLIWNYNGPSESSDGFGLKEVTVEYSADGAAWDTLKNATIAQGTAASDYTANTVVNFGGIVARYVRLVVGSNWGAQGQYGLSEVRFSYRPMRARDPHPADGETDVDATVTLTWSAGRTAALHDVHFSNSAPLVATGMALADSVTVNRYTVGSLDFGTTYYWRVNERNDAQNPSTWSGPIWTFVTCEYASIDDFENYDDTNRYIYSTWKDGFKNGTSSIVGYMDVPYAEKTIVHGGGQSMPFEYVNSESPFYSEAVRSFGDGHDWEEHGADALRLFVHGRADNDPDTLYLAVEDTRGNVAVVTHPDSSVLTTEDWQEWVIAYSAFDGVRLNEVRYVYLGVGDRDNPAPGGNGLIFIDDLEFGHPIGGVSPGRR